MTRATSPTPIGHLVRIAVAVVVVGVATGVGVLALVFVVHTVEHLLFGEAPGPFLDDLALPPVWLPIVTLTAAGVLGAVGWYAIRRWGRPVVSVEGAVAGKRMPALPTVIDVLLQVVIVAMGASIGKEVAPRELAALTSSRLTGWLGLDARWRRILIASASGAGLAAVYDVPLAGALFALEVLLVEFRPGTAVPALAISVIAVLVARPLVPDEPLYRLPAVHTTPALWIAAIVLGPLLGIAATWFMTLTKRAGAMRPSGARILVVMPIAFLVVGLAGAVVPLALGNGRALAQAGFALGAPAGVLLVTAIVKYFATVLTIGGGAVGGTLQPSVAIGSGLGAVAALGWGLLWPGVDPTGLAVVGAAAFLAASMRAPFTAIALVIEFTGTGVDLVIPIFLGVAGSLAAAALVRPRGLQAFRAIDPGRE